VRRCAVSIARPCATLSRELQSGRGRQAMQQLVAILTWRKVEPAPAGAEKTALVGETEQIGGLPERKMQPAEILIRQFAAGGCEQVHGRGFLLPPTPPPGA